MKSLQMFGKVVLMLLGLVVVSATAQSQSASGKTTAAERAALLKVIDDIGKYLLEGEIPPPGVVDDARLGTLAEAGHFYYDYMTLAGRHGRKIMELEQAFAEEEPLADKQFRDVASINAIRSREIATRAGITEEYRQYHLSQDRAPGRVSALEIPSEYREGMVQAFVDRPARAEKLGIRLSEAIDAKYYSLDSLYAFMLSAHGRYRLNNAGGLEFFKPGDRDQYQTLINSVLALEEDENKRRAELAGSL